MSITKLTEGKKHDIITVKSINSLISKLVEIRDKFGNSIREKTGQIDLTSFNTTIASLNKIIDNTYVVEIKKDIEYIENSHYVKDAGEFSSRIKIPNALDLIKVGEYQYNEYVKIINELIDVCLHDGSYNADHNASQCSSQGGGGSDSGCTGDCSNYMGENGSAYDGGGCATGHCVIH